MDETCINRFGPLSTSAFSLLFFTCKGTVVAAVPSSKPYEPKPEQVYKAPVSTPEVIKLEGSIQKTENYPIDLATVLKLAQDQNLLIASSEKNTEVLKSRYRQKQAALLPNIDASLNQSRLNGGQQVFGDVVQVIRTTVQPQVRLSWTLYPGGKNIYEMLAAKQRQQSSDFLLKETYQEQLAGAAEDYYKLLDSFTEVKPDAFISHY